MYKLSLWLQLTEFYNGFFFFSVGGMVQRSPRGFVATDERALLTDEEVDWPAASAEGGSGPFMHCLLDVLVDSRPPELTAS